MICVNKAELESGSVLKPIMAALDQKIALTIRSDIYENIDEAAQISNDLICTQFGLSEDSIDERDRDLLNRVAKVLSAGDNLHLEAIASRLDLRHDRLEYFALVQAE